MVVCNLIVIELVNRDTHPFQPLYYRSLSLISTNSSNNICIVFAHKVTGLLIVNLYVYRSVSGGFMGTIHAAKTPLSNSPVAVNTESLIYIPRSDANNDTRCGHQRG